MAYTRWGVTVATALTLTGVTVTDDDLTAAEDTIRDYLGWTPDPLRYPTIGGTMDQRARLFGRAIAWQAAYDKGHTPSPTDGQVNAVVSESIGGDYSYSKAHATADREVIAPRAMALLNRSGFHNRLGMTTRVERADAFAAQRPESP